MNESVAAKLFRFVERRGPDECWPWTGSATLHDGRGTVWDGQRNLTVPRAMWERERGEIPPGMFVCHTCDNPNCVNPAHLWLGTNRDNMLDCANKGRIFSGSPGVPAHLKPKGEQHGHAKLTAAQVLEIRASYRRYDRRLGSGALAKKYGVTPTTIQRVLRGESWKCLTPESAEPDDAPTVNACSGANYHIAACTGTCGEQPAEPQPTTKTED